MMSLWQQPRWLRSLVFVAGNLAVGLMVTVACVLPAREFFAGRDRQITQQRMALARFKAVAAQEAGVQAAAGKAAADRAEFLVGKTEGVINANLQTRLKAVAGAAGARLRSVLNLPAQSDKQVRYAGSRIELFGSLASIHRAVHAIESAKPYLFIKAASMRLSPAIAPKGVAREPIIEARLDVFAAIRIESEQ